MNGYRHSAAAFCCGTVLAVLPGIPQVNAQSSASVPSLGAHTLLAQSEGFGTNPRCGRDSGNFRRNTAK